MLFINTYKPSQNYIFFLNLPLIVVVGGGGEIRLIEIQNSKFYTFFGKEIQP